MRRLRKGEVELGMVVNFNLTSNKSVQGEVVYLYENLQPTDKGFRIEIEGTPYVFGNTDWHLKKVFLVDDVKEEVSVTKKGPIKSDGGNVWTDSHYNFDYQLTQKDIEKGSIRVDAYFVNRMWKLNQADDTGAVFHCLKTLTRLSNNKNPLEREIKALYGQIKCLATMHHVDL